MGNRAIAQGSMGIAAGDPDNDGDLDLFVTNFNGEPNAFYEQFSSGLYLTDSDGVQKVAYKQSSAGRFVDQTRKVGLADLSFAEVGFGTQFVDFNLDGQLEIIVANGDITDLENGYPYKMPCQIFRSLNNGRSWQILPPTAWGSISANITSDGRLPGRMSMPMARWIASSGISLNQPHC